MTYYKIEERNPFGFYEIPEIFASFESAKRRIEYALDGLKEIFPDYTETIGDESYSIYFESRYGGGIGYKIIQRFAN